MTHREIYQRVQELKIIPVIKLEDEALVLPLSDALVSAGLPVAEITFRTAAAEGSIRKLAANRPDVLIGAGTILTIEQAKEAMEAGASFLVSPGFNPELVEFAKTQGILHIPGANSPTQVEMGLRAGLEVLKFYPAEASGGIKMLKALSAVYEVDYMPTGGISADNICSYLELSKVVCCGGSWMVKPELIASGKFDEIERLTKEAVSLAGACGK